MKKIFLIILLINCRIACFAQYNFTEVQNFIKDNLPELGGRAVLVVWKNGNIICNFNENELTRKQKIIGKLMAKKLGKDKNDVNKDFDITTKERIASCSKWLSAALVMTFIDEGKLSLEDTVGKFLPNLTKNNKGNIKIWQCLSHLTAIKPGNLKEELQAFKAMQSMDEAIAAIAVQPMEGEPGKVFHYSNIGLQIAGAVLEKISGKTFEKLFAEKIATPCLMKNTDFGNGKIALPAGGAFSTTQDYINFLQMILNKGTFKGKQILTPKAIEQMQIDRVTADIKVVYSPAEAGSWGYGFGEWVMDESPLQTSPDGGGLKEYKRQSAVTSPGLFGSFPWVDYKNNYVAMLFTFNLKNKGRNELYKSLKQLVDQAVSKGK